MPLDNLPAEHPWSGPKELRDLIVAMFSANPNTRPDAKMFLQRMESLCGNTGMTICIASKGL